MTMVREAIVAPYTVLGWRVDDIELVADRLLGHGGVFERFGELPQDARGIWTACDGSKVAWFKAPKGQILIVS